MSASAILERGGVLFSPAHSGDATTVTSATSPRCGCEDAPLEKSPWASYSSTVYIVRQTSISSDWFLQTGALPALQHALHIEIDKK